MLEARGERVHPASAHLANESGHIESECAEHDLHCFQAIRRMDEILLANFMTFHDVVRDDQYDLWIGDEAWELDYYLHENPEQKRAAYVWLTDFVGWLPMQDGGDREAFLTADYNAEMIEHIARFPRIRDRAIYVGNDSDIVPDAFGPDLPFIRDWTREHYDFAGYVTGFDPADFADREALRDELGYAPDEQVCIVTVGGSGVGGHLLRRVIEAFPEAKIVVHPESIREVRDLADAICSTEKMISYCKSSPAKQFVVVTESGIIHRMQKECSGKEFICAPTFDVMRMPGDNCRCSECKYMKMNTLEKVRDCIKRLAPRIELPEEILNRARLPIERMLEISLK